ncbi:peptidoglycan DD-metalloendopeptidase family protein [Camelliibacillus cellulosilyticus]|uniref:Peptidoglycan DD-metalloendopeptidase family protein n=1 Tax=Camelliibacillus cellulosilyticus TaxID=2174486 RepID=A0ABV9GKU8_9BACL
MNRIDEIRKRHGERKRRMSHQAPTYTSYTSLEPAPPRKETGPSHHPLFRPQWFLVKCLLAAALVGGVALLYKINPSGFTAVKPVIHQTLSQDLNFAKVSDWYEKAFGEPLAFFPTKNKPKETKQTGVNNKSDFAMPVNGTITESFSDHTNGVYLKTDANAEVKAAASGFVVYVGKKDKIGTTVIIRHANDEESWYGQLKTTDVKLYDFVKQEQKIGTVASQAANDAGTFYFALKKGDRFVDPIQVIKFE